MGLTPASTVAPGNGIVDMLTHLVDRSRFNQRPDNDALVKTIPTFSAFTASASLFTNLS
jgi:hypothetical protein